MAQRGGYVGVKKLWRCRLGFHSEPLSQGVVGYCTHPHCDHFVRVHMDRLGKVWTRYVEKPNDADRPRGSHQ